MLLNKKKSELIEKFKLHKNDCGSTEVQIASLSLDIILLTGHLKIYKHDFHSRRGLIRKVSKRKALLKYLKNRNMKKYFAILKELNIRK